MKKKLAVAAAMALAITVSGCGTSDNSGGGSTTGSGSAEDTELIVWTVENDDAADEVWNQMVGAFQDANPGVTITTEQYSTDQVKEAIRLALGTDSFPDIYRYWEGPGLGGELIANGASLDLTKYYDEYKWSDRFSETVLANITQYGGYNGVPWIIAGEAMYYNKDLFEQAGISAVPTTYDELVAAADKLKAADITPFTTGGTVNWYVMRLLDSLIETKCGADTADKLNTLKASWATESCVTESFTELKKWADNYFNDGYMSLDDTQSNDLFYTNQAAMALQGGWFTTNLATGGMDPNTVGIFPFPTGTGRLYGFGEAFYIGSGSKNPDMAAKFLDFVTNTDNQTLSAGKWGSPSVNKNVAADTTNPLNPLWPEIFNNATGMYMNNDQNMSLEVTTEYWRIQNSVLTGDIAPDQAGTEFQKFIDANS